MSWYYLFYPRPAFVIGSGQGEEVNMMTASWVTPVSTEPPTVGVAVDKETYTHELIKKYKQFTVSVVEDVDLLWYLGTTHGKEKMERVEWFRGEKVPSPIPKAAIGWAEAKVVKDVDVGDVTFFIGEIVHWKALKGFGKWGWDLNEVKVPLQKAGRLFLVPPCKEVWAKKS